MDVWQAFSQMLASLGEVEPKYRNQPIITNQSLKHQRQHLRYTETLYAIIKSQFDIILAINLRRR